MSRLMHMSQGFKPINFKKKIELEKVIGESLPNGLDIGEVCIPAGTYAWQFDDEYKVVLRYSSKIKPNDRAACDELAERNLYFRGLLRRF